MKGENIIFRIEKDLKDKLLKKAGSQGKTISQAIRELVISYTTDQKLTKEALESITKK